MSPQLQSPPSTEWKRRLPRSNAPHPDESLAGYVLNLAYRLDLPPIDLIKRTGLAPKSQVHALRVQFGERLPDGARHRFTTATGLTIAETDALTMKRFADLTVVRRMSKTSDANQWIDVRTTRYCPECLADSHTSATPTCYQSTSDNQMPHPVWNIRWLTPWAVACTQHGCLLLDRCPTCHTRINETTGQGRSLIPNITRPVTHPAACRSNPPTARPTDTCGTRLDHAQAPPAPPNVLALQGVLDQILDEQQPEGLTSLGMSVTGRQYLLDLRLVVIMLQLAADTTAFTNLPQTYRDAASRYVTARTQTVSTGSRRGRTLTIPPDGYTANTALLLTAAHLLEAGDDHEPINRLATRALVKEPQNWRKAQATSEPSRALWAALTRDRLHTTAPGRLSTHLTNRALTLQTHNIPAYLPRNLYNQHFPGVDTVHARRLRRHVAIALVRFVGDFDTAERAGAYLGYSATLTGEATGRTSAAIPKGERPLAARIADIAHHLEQQPHLDYATPRARIGPNWTLPDDHWQTTLRNLADQGLHRRNIDWTKRRTLYSVWVWELLTGGDLRIAPMITSNPELHPDTVRRLLDLQRVVTPRHHDLVAELAATIRATTFVDVLQPNPPHSGLTPALLPAPL